MVANENDTQDRAQARSGASRAARARAAEGDSQEEPFADGETEASAQESLRQFIQDEPEGGGENGQQAEANAQDGTPASEDGQEPESNGGAIAVHPGTRVPDDGVPSGYAALDIPDPGYIGYVLSENLGGRPLSAQDFDVIKVPPGGVRYWNVITPEGEKDIDTVTGVIVQFTKPRAFWIVPLEQSDGHSPPDCFSDPEGRVGTGKRWEGDDEDEGDRHDCAACPLNQWESGANGRGKACKEKRMLYLMQEDELLPVVVQAPATSIRPLERYFLSLAKGRDPRPYWQVKTDLTLEADRTGQFPFGRIVAHRGGAVELAHVGRLEAYRKSINQIILQNTIPLQQDQADQ